MDNHGEFEGPVEKFVEWIDGLYRERVETMSHMLTTHRVQIAGDEACAETYVLVYMKSRPVEGQQVLLVGAGRYLDRFTSQQGRWQIADRKVLVDIQQMHPIVSANQQGLVRDLAYGLPSTQEPVFAHFAELV